MSPPRVGVVVVFLGSIVLGRCHVVPTLVSKMADPTTTLASIPLHPCALDFLGVSLPITRVPFSRPLRVPTATSIMRRSSVGVLLAGLGIPGNRGMTVTASTVLLSVATLAVILVQGHRANDAAELFYWPKSVPIVCFRPRRHVVHPMQSAHTEIQHIPPSASVQP